MMDKLISQQAAINVVSEITTTMSVCTNKDECYGMKRMQKQAITELENLPSAEPEVISKWKKEFREYVDSLDIARDDWKGIIEYINDAPTVQPEEIALHESCTNCPLYDKDRHSCPRFNKVIPEALRELQAAQPERKTGRWIPVNERLPEEGKAVLTQAKFKDDVKMAVSSRIDYNYWTTWGTRDINIIAWMPLPEAYQAERREDG